MDNEAIILAGGLGTRLKDIISDLPKPMAPINNRPFLEYLLDFINNFAIKHVVLFVSYKSEVIKNHFGKNYKNIKLSYSEKNPPPDTGGSIISCLSKIKNKNVLVINGDTLFHINLKEFYTFHKNKKADFSVALKAMRNVSRYGSVKIDGEKKIIGFEEKNKNGEGLINGGFYLIKKNIFKKFRLPEKFSIEKDFLEKNYEQKNFYGYTSQAYFIDIGTPASYKQAQKDFLGF